MSDETFFSRWSRRKAGIAEPPPAPVAAPAPVPVAVVPDAEPVAEPAPAPPTLADVEALDVKTVDLKRFVAADVDPAVKNAALKKLFAEPQWNVMDGLDVYIDDYGKPDPLPASMLRKMAQAQFLRLFDDEPGENPPRDQDADLRLQPDDAAGGEEPSRQPGEDPGREP